jgi:sugar lactone lactonase YvrE
MAMRNINLIKPLIVVLGFLVTSACDEDDGVVNQPLTSGNIETYAGQGPNNFGYEGDNGPARSSKLGFVTGIVVDSDDNVYYTDGAANVVRKISASNTVITTIAGTFAGFNSPAALYGGDGGPATAAHLNVPLAAAIDVLGNVLVADAGNNAIRQISAATSVISTVAGGGNTQGYLGDGGPASQSTLWNPYSVAVDADGNIYIADSQNNAVRKITIATGKISTVAGLGPNHGGYTGDAGTASLAKLNGPHGIAVDADEIIYIADTKNNVIRKIADGIITTIAGTGATGYTGDNGPAVLATFSSLKGLAVDGEGNIYIADSGNNVVRMINKETGKIITVAGNGTAGYSGDGGPAANSQLSSPLGVAIDGKGNLYIADSQNSAIRVVAQ